MIEQNQLRQELEENEIVLQVLPVDALVKEWRYRKNLDREVPKTNQISRWLGITC